MEKNKKATYKVLGATAGGSGIIPPNVTPCNPSACPIIKLSLPDLNALIERLDALLIKEPGPQSISVHVPPLETPVINVHLPEQAPPIIEHARDVPNLDLNFHIAKPWEVYLIVFGIYFLIFVLSWQLLPTIM